MATDRPISRRLFLRGGALVSSAILAGMPRIPWLHGPATGEAEAAIMGIGQELRDVLNEETVNRILVEALIRGGDFADLFAEQRFRTNIVLAEGRIESVTYGYPRGAGVRVSRRSQTGYAFSDEIAYNTLLDAARVASAVVENQSPVTPIDVTRRNLPAPFSLNLPVPLMDESRKFEILRRMDAAARAYDPRIVSVRLQYVDEVRDVLIGTSDGGYLVDRQFLVSIFCAPTAVSGGERRSRLATLGGRVDEGYLAAADPERVARDAAKQAITLLDAGPAPAGPMPVVIGPGWGGVLIHECFGHSLEGDGIRKKTSIREHQFGQKVCSDIVDIYDDSTVPNSRGSFKVDDEGTPSQKSHVVEKGVLKGYLWDRLNAKLTKNTSSANGRRTSYREFPIPRMTNTYIAGGTSKAEDLIGSVKNGLYAKAMGGGSVNPADGQFSFVVSEAYMIENGKLTSAVKGATLTGDAADAMLRVEGLGDDLLIDVKTGTCGKDGQFKPVGVGQPTVLFSEMTVGGTRA